MEEQFAGPCEGDSEVLKDSQAVLVKVKHSAVRRAAKYTSVEELNE